MSKVWKSPELQPPVRAFRTVLALAQRLRYQMDDRLRADGLTTQQAALLTVVIAMGEPSATQAAAALGTTHQNIAQLVGALERKGFLEVRPDPADRRRKLLATTPASDAYWIGRDQDDIAAIASWFAVLSPSEVDTLCELADRVLGGLRSHP
ncbi:MarR family winged helix-turn-helix transcriptional regulator [Phytohabitans aurantiacus]|uniref:MarR family transcriptional regulator n=1 Tax=Phytohabitans aurantiacus TaxID=3016789 RepID=A0ABQ5QXW4_9ACTN|nr:helix-turn-helix domain-containing protein [Phytohabitans aurantiacus]GLH99140.1 MarR family transcriptional regulator [Phytohabitans aurantiacus]